MSEAGMWGTEVARGDGPVPFLVYQQRRRQVTELLDDAARWADRDHLVQGRRRVTLPGRDLSAVRSISLGGSPVTPELSDRLRAAFPAVRRGVSTIYGMTEAGGTVAAATAAELTAFAAARLGRFQVPARWRLQEEPLPMTDAGKIAKHELRDVWLAELKEEPARKAGTP